MSKPIPNFLARSKEHHRTIGDAGAERLMDESRRWDIGYILKGGGTLIFPHATLEVCGHQIAAVVNACLDSGTETVLALGVLHALTPELQAARQRVAEGGDPANEASWGMQGPGALGREDWLSEFSISHFQYLWDYEVRRRGLTRPPRLVMRYPNLAAGHPELLPGFAEVEQIAGDAAMVATMDPCHHGIGYGDSIENALAPERGGLEFARQRITESMSLLCTGSYDDYIRSCIEARSDGRDVGQLLAQLRKPRQFEILDLVADDMTGPYSSPAPTWVAGALITLTP